MDEKFIRTEMLIGKDGIKKLKKAKVAVFGVGGVGSFVCEGLARSGVGNFALIDHDKVAESNINRQIIATTKTIGKYKVDVMKKRILEINPDANVEVFKEFYLPDSKSNIITKDLTYVVDCVDTVTAKLDIVSKCNELKIPVISSMGTGNKLNPLKFEITDISKTTVCPLAKVMRRELRKRGINKLKVIYSKEEPLNPEAPEEESSTSKKKVPGSISFVPPVAGLVIAGEVIKEIALK